MTVVVGEVVEYTEIAAVVVAVSSGRVVRWDTGELVEGAVQTVVASSFGCSAVDNEMPGCSRWERVWHFLPASVNQ